MAKATQNKKRKKTSNYKPLVIIIIVLAAIIGASMIISYFLTKEETHIFTEEQEQVDEFKIEDLESIKTPIEGTWVSNYDGAILTINGLTFSIDLPSVEQAVSVKGTMAVEQNLVTFNNTNGDETCRNTEGHYQFSFENDEISFKLIKDNCSSRKERMTASWFKL